MAVSAVLPNVPGQIACLPVAASTEKASEAANRFARTEGHSEQITRRAPDAEVALRNYDSQPAAYDAAEHGFACRAAEQKLCCIRAYQSSHQCYLQDRPDGGRLEAAPASHPPKSGSARQVPEPITHSGKRHHRVKRLPAASEISHGPIGPISLRFVSVRSFPSDCQMRIRA